MMMIRSRHVVTMIRSCHSEEVLASNAQGAKVILES